MKKRKAVSGILRVAKEPDCGGPEDEGWMEPDPIRGKTYIEGADGQYYLVHPRQIAVFIVLERVDACRLDGLSVVFETPLSRLGKKYWAYDLRLPD